LFSFDITLSESEDKKPGTGSKIPPPPTPLAPVLLAISDISDCASSAAGSSPSMETADLIVLNGNKLIDIYYFLLDIYVEPAPAAVPRAAAAGAAAYVSEVCGLPSGIKG
tara:strand:+ start:109 stop:438 length:330 start_codon:yes stop_codon:yes gene_type:complete